MSKNKNVYAEVVDGIVHFRRKAPKGKYVKVSHKDHMALVHELNETPNTRAAIEGGKVVSEAVFVALTWDDIRFKAGNILRRTDRIVSVPDHHIDGSPITKKQKTDVLAYRAAIWTIEKDFSSPDAVVWPTPPVGV